MGLILLLLLGDFLFWQQHVGLSLALFSLAVTLVASHGSPLRLRLVALSISLAGALPVVDYVLPLSVAFLLAGLISSVVVLARADHGRGACTFILHLADFLIALPDRWLFALRGLLRPFAARGPGPGRAVAHRDRGTRGRGLRDWAFPLGGSLIFLALILEANPLLLQLGRETLDPWTLILRVCFWAGLALMILPFLSRRPAAKMAHLPAWRVLQLPGLNPRSVLRALILFNLLIGLQILSDASILIGGASLPAGMNFSEYAHRGAWPLLATAMLAGGFTLAARPFLQEHRALRPLLLLWLVQNILLSGAAALRLDHYIDAYGLTFLRLYALIWMGLVGFSLMLMAWQVLAMRSNSWVVIRLFCAALSVLYASSFINFAALIAAQNLSRDRIDIPYICDLGPQAAAEVRLAAHRRPEAALLTSYCAAGRAPKIRGWRDWGFRNADVLHKLALQQAQAEGEAG
ncbi:DUF4173 domain-containing protein [Xinfangfangia sp. D13-10-4-6]|uniref:DUF4153 domain-containing protein n=1 Tax=Pseudogemmobacter hezensis TaxID=2737662 RepID=UPI001556F1AF|nr:DUF4173 domain-containing protein [Pseudogemmobacter hezensis]NPD15652.1 DUF4173 domain-containing protein [Pseudogemmobacter hezensis]